MDKYNLNARIYPILLLFFPIIIIGIAYSIEYENYIQVLSTLGITAALSYFFSNIGRDYGLKRQEFLWKSWGGMPSCQLFSYENDFIDKITKDRYHAKLSSLLPVNDDINFKNSDESKLFEIYRSWSKYLITKTRDKNKYSLLFKENISYGFRRNLFGLKTISIILIICIFLSNFMYQLFIHDFINISSYPLEFFISQFILLVVLFIWLFIINQKWVKIPAFAYAERLLETIDIIE